MDEGKVDDVSSRYKGLTPLGRWVTGFVAALAVDAVLRYVFNVGGAVLAVAPLVVLVGVAALLHPLQAAPPNE